MILVYDTGSIKNNYEKHVLFWQKFTLFFTLMKTEQLV